MSVTLAGVLQVDITALQMTVDLGATVPAVAGSKFSPDVFDGVMHMGNYDAILEAVMRGTWTPGGALGGHILINPPSGSLAFRLGY